MRKQVGVIRGSIARSLPTGRPVAWIAVVLGAGFIAVCSAEEPNRPQLDLNRASPTYDIVKREIKIDGDLADWNGVEANAVGGRRHLWYGQDMTPAKWRGDKDHSYSWRATWNGNRLYFLFEITDDNVIVPPQQPNSFLNDCIEILLDPKNTGGNRADETDGKKTLNGYEMHFLPGEKQLVFVDDALSPLYPIASPQNELFKKQWNGETAFKKTPGGYVMEIAFSIPGVQLKPDMVMGMDTDTCDDDGASRKSLQIWTGKQVDFWITMDHYGKVTLKGAK